jgi:hypothetical protein
VKYRVTGFVTISVTVDVDASSEAEARERARAASMQTFCHQCADGDPDAWSTSGELDGTPTIETVKPLRERRP